MPTVQKKNLGLVVTREPGDILEGLGIYPDAVLKATKEDLRRGGAAGAAPLLQAEHIRIQKDLLAADGWTDPLRSLTTDSTSSSHIRLAAQIFAAPVSAPPTQEMFLHDHAMEVHARWLLDLPLVPGNATCANVKRGTHQRCAQPLDPTLHHVWGCARARQDTRSEEGNQHSTPILRTVAST